MAGDPRYANYQARVKACKRVRAEEDVCWLCGRPVDKSLPAGLDGSPEVDEIVPVSLGGSPTDRTNLHLSHRICNERRGNAEYDEATDTFVRPGRVESMTTTRRW